jgi:hypothetical protein
MAELRNLDKFDARPETNKENGESSVIVNIVNGVVVNTPG